MRSAGSCLSALLILIIVAQAEGSNPVEISDLENDKVASCSTFKTTDSIS